MLELFKSEYGRYKYWGIGCFILVLVIYSFLARLKPFLQPDPMKSFLIPTILFGAAFVFGIVQMALHKRKNQWTYLAHRPLSMPKIYLSLTLAGFVILLLVLTLPWLLIVLSLDFFGSTVVDNRHYVYGLYLLITSLFAYLVGQLVITNASRAIICIASVIISFLFLSPISNIALFLPLIILSLILVYLNIKSFKPDLNTYVNTPLFVLVISVMMSFEFANILFMVMSIEAQLPNTFTNRTPKPDAINTMKQKNAIEKLRYVLQNSDHPQVQDLLVQAQLIEPERRMVGTEGYPGTRIGQLHIEDFGSSYRIKDEASNSTWQFSHDSQLIEGRDSFTGAPVGAIGIQGFIEDTALASDSDKFMELPILLSNGFIGTRSQYFHADYKDRVLTPKLQFPEGEFDMTGPVRRKDDIMVITSKETLIFNKAALINIDSWVEPEYKVPHPLPATRIHNIHTYRIAQSYLLLYFSANHFGYDQPGATILLAKANGEVEVLGKHAFTQYDQPAWRRFVNYTISPVAEYIFWASYAELDAHPIAPSTIQYYKQRQYPSSVLTFVLVTHILSAIMVFLLSRHHKLTATLTTIWLFTSICFGVSGLMSFVFLNPWQITRTIFIRDKSTQHAQQITAIH
jgi:hypothetical protein